MSLLPRWRSDRQEEKRATRYLAAIQSEPADADVSWLAKIATRGDEDHARWELRYARRALGLLVAQRDALDDRTASLVARALSAAFERDPRIDDDRRDLAARQFNARLSAYRDALRARPARTGTQMGQTLLAFAGGAFRDVDDQVRRATELVVGYEREANAALRDAFGAADLPENVAPSALADSGR